MGFYYVTKTARSWQQPLESAIFKADIIDIVEKLEKESIKGTLKTIYRPLLFFKATKGYKKIDNKELVWEFKTTMPIDSIKINFFQTTLPVKLFDLKNLIKTFNDDLKRMFFRLKHMKNIYNMAKDNLIFE